MFSTTVKTLRIDNGSEFFNNEFKSLMATLGIFHQSTCVYTPQQNGIAERKHRTILQMDRALMFQASVPLKFWGECISTAVYLINKLPLKLFHYKTPFELLYSHPPSLSHIKTFGCLSFATFPKILNKCSPKANFCYAVLLLISEGLYII